MIAACLGWAHLAQPAPAAVIRVIYSDAAGEGFNDPTAALPIGGNFGITLGEQRRIAIARAAQIWADLIDSPVEIDFEVRFNPLRCQAGSAVLGQASPNSLHSDFAGAPLAGTFYTAALANRLAGFDLCPRGSCRNSSDISATFNSSFGTDCAFAGHWYYGLDAAPVDGGADLVTVALHELAHGLGFLSLVDGDSGEGFMDMDDAFSNFVEDHRLARTFDQMSESERAAAVVSVRDLHFIGDSVVAASGSLDSGTAADGHVRLYAPASLDPGSTLSHFDWILFPNQLMEPSLESPIHDVGLAAELFDDIGWSLLGGACSGDCDSDRRVSAAELVLAVRVALGELTVESCPFADGDADGRIGVGELVRGVRSALGGCGGTVIEVAEPLRGVVGGSPECAGDCNGNGRVSVDELVRGVGIALGRGEVDGCENMDGNGDGRVGVNELIAAVGSALSGCPCPFDLLDERAGQERACVFAGAWSQSCGGSDLPATFSVRGGLVGVAVITGTGSPALNFFAQATSGRDAALVGFMFGDVTEPIGGQVQLSEDGRALTVTPNLDIGVAIDECAFTDYRGEIDRIITTGATSLVVERLDRVNADLTATPPQ